MATRLLPVLTYHRVLEAEDPLVPGDPDVRLFERHVVALARAFRPLPLIEAIERRRAGTLPARAVAVTFDDGYRDNHDLAAPILRRHGVPATFFVATSFLDGGRMWNDTLTEWVRRLEGAEVDLTAEGCGVLPIGSDAAKLATIERLLRDLKHLPEAERGRRVARIVATRDPSRALPDDLMMTSEQVRTLTRDGMQVGAHTVRHPILSRLEDADARAEITACKAELERLTGERVQLFAYPNGRPGDDYDARHVNMVRDAGYAAAFSTRHGAVDGTSELFELPRMSPWDRSGWRLAARMLATHLRLI